MAEKAEREDEKFAWDADVRPDQQASVDPTESGTVYRLSGPNPMLEATEPVNRVPAVEVTPRRRVTAKDTGNGWALTGYNLLIFLTSVCVMTLELTASRIIGKHLGASLYTWTSVIGVILAGITLGNWLGGWLADRFDRSRSLNWMYLLSSIFSASVLFLEQFLQVLDRPVYITWPMWVLTVVALLFLLPALALGATSPLIASLALARSHKLGATVGNVYAWGACGSIVGTFLTGFYLMDHLGSRAIIAVVSGSLALMAVILAGKQYVFRTAVVCGWIQLFLFIWAAASATEDSWAWVSSTSAGCIKTVAGDEGDQRRAQWQQFGGSLGRKVHELGLVIGVRDDQIGRYTDESEYSFIQVTEGREDGAPVKVLQLDKLIHSYYNPATPSSLHYDYERIYAAVMKVAASAQSDVSRVTLDEFPGWPEIRAQLPASIDFDETTRQLTVSHVDAPLVDRLLDLSPDADYWDAVEQISIITSQPGWGGIEAQTLDQLPEGVSIPADLSTSIRFDPTLRLLTAYEPITPEVRDRLIRLSPRGPWYVAVNALRQQSGKVSSFFIGGGGYIFPRWVAAEFPGSTRIDVAELDPAVRKVVLQELGMTAQDEELIDTKVGDARQVVDDYLRENRRRLANQQQPVLYDFIFGDAFNDFSVPWHLTTQEFQQKCKDLLSPQGVLQVNLIDIYPRTEYPGQPVAQGEVEYKNFLPPGLLKGTDYPPQAWIPVLARFGKLDVQCRAADDFRLRARERLTDYQRKVLSNLDRSNSAWSQAVFRLVEETRRSVPFSGTVPSLLHPRQSTPGEWFAAGGDVPALELQPASSGQFVLGYRGMMTDQEHRKLSDLAPQDSAWTNAIDELQRRSRLEPAGQLLGRFVYTATTVFPHVYLFSTTPNQVGVTRDTFVIVCALQPLEIQRLSETGHWTGKPFAAFETLGDANEVRLSGHMASVLAMARGQRLTDDFSPVENLLLPIFAGQ